MSRYQVSDELWKQSLSDYDELKGIQWDCQALDGANRHDSQLVRETLESILVKRPRTSKRRSQTLCVDASYVGAKVARIVESPNLSGINSLFENETTKRKLSKQNAQKSVASVRRTRA